MRSLRIEKVTLNIGTGKEQANIERGIRLLTMLTGRTPVRTVTQKRIPGWGLRPGLPVGVKVTLRKADAQAVLLRLLDARDMRLSLRSFDSQGNVSFGLTEYIDVPGAKYDPEIGMMGLQVTVTLERPGFSIKRRKNASNVGVKHRISKEEAVAFAKEAWKIKIMEEE